MPETCSVSSNCMLWFSAGVSGLCLVRWRRLPIIYETTELGKKSAIHLEGLERVSGAIFGWLLEWYVTISSVGGQLPIEYLLPMSQLGYLSAIRTTQRSTHAIVTPLH